MRLGPIGIGVPELLVILVLVLIVFGPKNLPKLGSALGKTVKNLRDGIGAGKKESASEVVEGEAVIETVEEPVVPGAAPAAATSSQAAGASPSKKVRKVVVKKKTD